METQRAIAQLQTENEMLVDRVAKLEQRVADLEYNTKRYLPSDIEQEGTVDEGGGVDGYSGPEPAPVKKGETGGKKGAHKK